MISESAPSSVLLRAFMGVVLFLATSCQWGVASLDAAVPEAEKQAGENRNQSTGSQPISPAADLTPNLGLAALRKRPGQIPARGISFVSARDLEEFSNSGGQLLTPVVAVHKTEQAPSTNALSFYSGLSIYTNRQAPVGDFSFLGAAVPIDGSFVLSGAETARNCNSTRR